MVREIMTDAQIAFAQETAGKRKGKVRRSGMARYNRPWNNTDQTTPDRADYMGRLVNAQAAAVDNMTRPDGPAAAPMFIVVRPRADRYVMALMDNLAKLDADAATAAREWYDRNRATLTVVQGSEWIDRLKAKINTYGGQPTMSTNGAAPEPVPASDDWARWRQLAAGLVELGGRNGARFAVDTNPGAVNSVAFWWIAPNRRGDRYFIRQVIGGRGPVPVRMDARASIALAERIIAAGAYECMLRYGREIGECGHCGRTLTNDESRAAGIGPVCRNKH